MDPSEVFDLRRMFVGDFPLLFLLEIAIRTAILYGYALLMLRLMGRRGMRQISAFDLAIIIALGSAVGDPMFYADVPVLHGMVVITVIVVMERLLAELVQRSEKADTFISGKPVRVVHEGRLEEPEGAGTMLSREELFGELRTHQIQQLGEVRTAYLEQSGEVSVFLFDETKVRPGLPIIPPWELAPPVCYSLGENVQESGSHACYKCGETLELQSGETLPACPNCGGDQWVVARRAPLDHLSLD